MEIKREHQTNVWCVIAAFLAVMLKLSRVRGLG